MCQQIPRFSAHMYGLGFPRRKAFTDRAYYIIERPDLQITRSCHTAPIGVADGKVSCKFAVIRANEIHKEVPSVLLQGTFLLLPTGEKTDMPFEKRENLFRAEVQGLQEGEYEIILEK